MGRTLEYPKKAQNTVKRYANRGTYDLGAIHSIINTTSVLHVSFASSSDDPFPAILPMIGVMGSFEYPSAALDEPLDCYLHGYVSSRIMNLARGSADGLPICVAATKVDGLVLSLTPNSHSYNYRSAVLQGYAQLVDNVEEKLFAMHLITNSVIPSRWENTRTPPDNAEMSSTQILRVKVVSGSGKVREGGPHDDAKDEKRGEVTAKTWTGVVPVWECLGEPILSGAGQIKELPSYIGEYVRERREEGEKFARLQAEKP